MSGFPFMAFLFITYMLLPASSRDTFNAVMPSNMTALSGSCMQIPCTYNVSDFEDKLKRTERMFGCWLKGTHDMSGLIFNSSQPVINGFSHIEMLGNLSRRECTTVVYDVINNHSYYFRVQMEPDVFRATFLNAVNVSVLDVPNPPKLNDVQIVMENTSVTVICSAEAFCPKQSPTLSWSNIPTSAIITTQLQEKPDKTQAVISTMTFNVSYTDDWRNISCNATYPRINSNNTTVKSSTILQVLFSPKETHIIIELNSSVSVGTNVTLTCKSKANPSNNINYTWYKRGEQTLLASGDQMTFNVSKTSGGWYFCRAENKHGAQKSEEIQLTVKGIPKSFMTLIAGWVGGVLAFLLLLLLVIVFIRKQRTQASNKSVVGEADLSNQDQKTDVPINSVYTNSAYVANEQPEMPKNESDIIHYGEINFSTLQAECPTQKSSGQETVYAEVCGSAKKMNQD